MAFFRKYGSTFYTVFPVKIFVNNYLRDCEQLETISQYRFLSSPENSDFDLLSLFIHVPSR